MAQRVAATLTPVAPDDLFLALHGAYRAILGADAPRGALVCLVAQCCLECAWGRACHANNLGNMKSRPGGATDWCFFGCDEVLLLTEAQRIVAADPTHARIEWQKGGIAGVWFDPPAPTEAPSASSSFCCFAAYPSLEAGATAWLDMQHGRFSSAWPALLSGDARAFGHALKLAGYYTAPEAQYVATLAAVAAQLDGELPQTHIETADPAA